MRARAGRKAGAVAVLALAMIASGCAVGTGGGSGADVKYSRDEALHGDLTIMGFSGVDEIATTRMDDAKKGLGGVTVKAAEGDFDLQQFLSSVAAGKPPSLIYVSRNQVGSLAARGAILPLDACVDGEKIPKDDFIPSALAQVTLDGHVYGIPEFDSVQIVMANRSLLDKAGKKLSDVNGSDWEAMSKAATALTAHAGSGLSVIGVDTKLPEFLPLWAKANGADLISADGRKAQLDDPKVVEALTWAASIYKDEGGFGAVKAFRDSADFFGAGNQFATGTLGAMPMEQWYVNVLNEVSPDAPMAFDTVHERKGGPIAFASGSAWAIPAKSANPQAACRFARIMTSTQAWMDAAKARADARTKDGKAFTGVLTGNRAVDEKIKPMTEGAAEPWASAISAMYTADQHTFSLPANPADAEFTAAMNDAVNAVLNGQKSPKDALAAAQKQAQQALDKGWAALEKKK
ncbi:Carbohydrate ABC transporter substrate-binding protein, CUT1 family [Microbacterium sp. 8M]|uniref:ABC transporter substrate-binding protein n=1 Tax=Microbacterium sp. 8M TaxID=2653153 RepID=UPI0012F2BB85|nr:extracellular solute-binding protein [Microbacterium sp. 8M]VXB58331.1 Carbohydrate ABC transporter substrate-binding protein, CUT1 family [Microbacterium sp. 8M]